ncbi:hypothetical protein P170DRAFT_510546 [Aspergillus steynii IBT 23096]|uniref:Uncharacterized protein n=1 Tax=Aspergillus steynii IBT 23096 TaxID=1392250 RepID=A0A2I2G4J2_9EURO|nr:uncharacterized protein P170DRAFT_510546 [Aspergillus steynii IBT 23096]PLB47797.1 hypothetical protein P170DRAFT_510546 [Aspergillus steynii IBT 23096]
MAPPKPITAKEAIKSAVPDLKVGPYHTTSNAFHRVDFVGDLAPWANFNEDAWQYSNATNWAGHKSVLGFEPKGTMKFYTAHEHVAVGDETGVQGRFNQNVGQTLTAACGAFGLDLSFADYKACADGSLLGRVPDSICMTSQGALRAVGEIKTPWVAAHHIQNMDIGYSDKQRRRALGQISLYMRSAHIRYGFLSTYDSTVFLRQVEKAGGQWGLEYSEPVSNDQAAGGNAGEITLREGFWFLLGEASGANYMANNNTPVGNWTK